MNPPPTKIILAADAVAYLPIHALSELQPSEDGEAWCEKFEIVADPQAGADTSIVTAQGDTGCIQRIIAERELGNFAVGVCDPLEILRSAKEAELCIIGGLINRPCFWIVADKHCGNTVSSLDVTYFCQHHPDLLTAHMWSNALFSEISGRNTNANQPIRRIVGSFDDVIDGVVYLKEKAQCSRIAALTPCVLSVALLMQSRTSDWDAYKLFDDHRHQNSLTTAFVVHRDALSDENGVFHSRAAYFISQVILAINYFRNNRGEMSNMIERICLDVNRFSEERQIDCATSLAGDVIVSDLKNKTIKGITRLASMPVDRSTADRVMNLMIGDNNEDIFCSACEIKQIDWENATRFYGSSLPSPAKPLDLLYSSTILKLSHDLVISKSLYGNTANQFTFNKQIFNERAYYANSILALATAFAIFAWVFAEKQFEYSNYLIPIVVYIAGLLVFFGKIRTPLFIKKLLSRINVSMVIAGGWIILIPLIIWGFSFALRLTYFGVTEDNISAQELLQFRRDHSVFYAISSIGGILDDWKIKRDDVYGIVTVAVSSWLSLTLGYVQARLALRAFWLKVGGLRPFVTLRAQLRGGKP